MEPEPCCFPSHTHPLPHRRALSPHPDAGLGMLWLARGNAALSVLQKSGLQPTSPLPKFPLPRSQDLCYPLLTQPAHRASQLTVTCLGGAEVFHSLSQRIGNATVVKFQGTHSTFSCDWKVLKSDAAVIPQLVTDFCLFTDTALLARLSPLMETWKS